jgi:nucleoside triphosphate pyrophosphatase
MAKPAIVLASRSPQRRALLEALGLDFEVRVPQVDEEAEGEPRDLVVRNALRKAEAMAADQRDALVIAGDTEVVIDGEVLGQPESEAEARAHLQRLSGSEHHVLGGLALIGPGAGNEPRTGVEVSTVAFRELDEPLLDAYLASGEWRGRAGSYAIQGLGSALVDIVRGDVSNVIGLPVGLLLRLAPELLSDR